MKNMGKGQAFRAFLDGMVIPLKEVGDGVFSGRDHGRRGWLYGRKMIRLLLRGAGTVIVMMEDSPSCGGAAHG